MGHIKIIIDIGDKHFEALVPTEGDVSFNMRHAYSMLLDEAAKFNLIKHTIHYVQES